MFQKEKNNYAQIYLVLKDICLEIQLDTYDVSTLQNLHIFEQSYVLFLVNMTYFHKFTEKMWIIGYQKGRVNVHVLHLHSIYFDLSNLMCTRENPFYIIYKLKMIVWIDFVIWPRFSSKFLFILFMSRIFNCTC